MTAMTAQMLQLTAALTQLVAAAPSPASPPPVSPASVPTHEPRVGTLERYAGEPEGCNPYITNCSILFSLQPHTFASEEAKVAFTINHLTDRARLWGTAEWERRTPACSSFLLFSAELRKVFGAVSRGPDPSGGLAELHQGDRTVADYALEFRTRARLSDWNEAAQCEVFLSGLAEYVKDELISFDLPANLDGLVELTSRVDRRIQARRQERRKGETDRRGCTRRRASPAATSITPGSQPVEAEPMEVGRTSLTREERERRHRGGLCLYCGQAGHFISRCPVKDAARP